MKVTILGCGSSGGVPQIDSGWGECDPQNVKNRRRRASILVQTDTTNLLVDTSPDCRDQLLDAGISRLDAVLYTHAHADHSHGIDDLRWVNVAMDDVLQAYGTTEQLNAVEKKFDYAFEPLKIVRDDGVRFFYKPTLVRNDISGPFTVGDIDVVEFEQHHGFSKTSGFRFGAVAYSTDVVELDEAAFDVLRGVDTWIVDCFCRDGHRTHSWLQNTLDWIERVKPRRAILTHMGRSLDYDTVLAETPDHVEPAYDGMVITV